MAGWAAVAVAAYGAYASDRSASKNRKAQEEAARRQEALTPPPLQDIKTPVEGRRRNNNNLAPTLLTGVGGIDPGSVNTGKTLLGG